MSQTKVGLHQGEVLFVGQIFTVCCVNLSHFPSRTKFKCVEYVHVVLAEQLLTKLHIVFLQHFNPEWNCFIFPVRTPWFYFQCSLCTAKNNAYKNVAIIWNILRRFNMRSSQSANLERSQVIQKLDTTAANWTLNRVSCKTRWDCNTKDLIYLIPITWLNLDWSSMRQSEDAMPIFYRAQYLE